VTSRQRLHYKFILANIKNSPTGKIAQPLQGKKRELEEEIESDRIPHYWNKLKKIKIEDPRGNFW
jgi:hypothetical protein